MLINYIIRAVRNMMIDAYIHQRNPNLRSVYKLLVCQTPDDGTIEATRKHVLDYWKESQLLNISIVMRDRVTKVCMAVQILMDYETGNRPNSPKNSPPEYDQLFFALERPVVELAKQKKILFRKGFCVRNSLSNQDVAYLTSAMMQQIRPIALQNGYNAIHCSSAVPGIVISNAFYNVIRLHIYHS